MNIERETIAWCSAACFSFSVMIVVAAFLMYLVDDVLMEVIGTLIVIVVLPYHGFSLSRFLTLYRAGSKKEPRYIEELLE